MSDDRTQGIDDAQRDALRDAARAVQRRAWAPYSRFQVGAALLDDQGRLHVGCNVENATFGATVCAERNAVGSAVADGARRFVAVAVVTDAGHPVMPCGICRQVLAEFADDLEVFAYDGTGNLRVSSLDALLPERFAGDDI